nr:RNA 2',3'-cyclic phosphodiesterase [Nocardia miyunensis]
MSESLRLFLAVEPDPELRRGLSRIIDELKREPRGDHVRWVRSENLHLTLRFLGAVATEDVTGISSLIRTATGKIGPFHVQVDTIAPFPSRKSPRAVVANITPSSELLELAAALEKTARSAGFAREKRPYAPHITLGRLTGSHTPPLREAMNADLEPLTVDKITLVKSEQIEHARRYTPLEYFSLREPSDEGV